MKKSIFGRVYEKKRSFIENLIKDVDSRIGVQNYSNDALKSFVENNYKVSFNFKIGKKYINENDFESIATNYRNNKRNEAYKELISIISDIKEKRKQESYKEIKKMLKDFVDIDKRNKELYKKLDVYNVNDINAILGFNCQKIIEDSNFLSEEDLGNYNNSFKNYLQKGDYAKAYELNESMFKIIDAKKIESLKEKIMKGAELSLDEALLLSKNKTLILLYDGKVEAIENYLTIHPKVFNEKITPYQVTRIAKNYKNKPELSTGLIKKILIKDNDLEGRILGIDVNGSIREGGDFEPENFIDTLVLDVKKIYNENKPMKFSEMINQTINAAAGSNIKGIGKYNYLLFK